MGSFTSCNICQILFKWSSQWGWDWQGVWHVWRKRGMYTEGFYFRKPKTTISLEKT